MSIVDFPEPHGPKKKRAEKTWRDDLDHGYLAGALGAALRQAREAKGIPRRVMARRIPSHHHLAAPGATIAPNTLRELEMGESNPTLAKVEELAALYGLRITLEAEPIPEADTA